MVRKKGVKSRKNERNARKNIAKMAKIEEKFKKCAKNISMKKM